MGVKKKIPLPNTWVEYTNTDFERWTIRWQGKNKHGGGSYKSWVEGQMVQYCKDLHKAYGSSLINGKNGSNPKLPKTFKTTETFHQNTLTNALLQEKHQQLYLDIRKEIERLVNRRSKSKSKPKEQTNTPATPTVPTLPFTHQPMICTPSPMTCSPQPHVFAQHDFFQQMQHMQRMHEQQMKQMMENTKHQMELQMKQMMDNNKHVLDEMMQSNQHVLNEMSNTNTKIKRTIKNTISNAVRKLKPTKEPTSTPIPKASNRIGKPLRSLHKASQSRLVNQAAELVQAVVGKDAAAINLVFHKLETKLIQ
eukprot:77041_1